MAYGKTNAGGGGGGGELHGCTIVAITNREDCIGLPATLSFNGAVIQTKLIESDLSIVFDAVQTDGEYTISAENAEGDAVIVNVTVTARNILDTDTVTVAVDLNSQLVNYTMLLDTTSGALNECIDITGGYAAYALRSNFDGSGWDVTVPTIRRENEYLQTYIQRNTFGITQGLIATGKLDLSDYNCLCFDTRATLTKITGDYYSAISIGIVPEIIESYSMKPNFTLVNQKSNIFTFDGVGIIDISNVSEGYLGCRLFNYTGNGLQQLANNNLRNAFLTEPDDWQTLMSKAGISVASLEEFFADTSKIATLLGNESAVRFMLNKCTGDFMAQAVANQNFLNALNNSPYKSLVFVNQHWSKFLFMVGVTA